MNLILLLVLVIAAGLRDFDRSLEQAAEGLGASRWNTLTRITLPLLGTVYIGTNSVEKAIGLIRDGLATHEPALKSAQPVYREFRAGDVRHSQADIGSQAGERRSCRSVRSHPARRRPSLFCVRGPK